MKKTLVTIICLAFAFAAQAQDRIELIHGPYLQDIGTTEATVVWIASTNSVGWVELAPDDGSHFYETERPKYFDSRNGIKTESRVHSVKITGLKPGTTYRYRVFSTEITEHKANFVSYGRTASTRVFQKEPLRLTTLDPEKESVSFAMLNDMHGDTLKLEKLIGQCDMDKTDMVLFVGDMVSIFNSEEQVFSGFMDKATEIFAAEKPVFYTRGNHETRGELAYCFQDYFSPSKEHIYYMFRQGPVCFIALDSGEDKPDSDIEYSGINVYDEYRSEQAEWLKKAVQSEEFRTAPFKIVTCHVPAMGGWHGEKEVKEKFIPILNEAGVDIMLTGHLHRRMHRNAGDDGVNFPVLVNSSEDVLQCTVSGKELKIRIVDLQGKTVDTLTIKK